MSLFIEVYVGSKANRILVADSHAWNLSNLRDTSDYRFVSIERGSKPLGIPPSEVTGEIQGHNRNQTVWSLVEKIAKESQVDT